MDLILEMRETAESYRRPHPYDAATVPCLFAALCIDEAIKAILAAELALFQHAEPERLTPRPEPIPEYWNYDAEREAKVEVEGLA